ncbi:MAG: hypothetical protein H6559_01095 [Lewinellaceae bacterium]|nr:hypothetical protein [Lewinellaceae bacterium]
MPSPCKPLYFFRRYELNRQALKANLVLEKVEAENSKNWTALKAASTPTSPMSSAPLTVILGMAEQIKRRPKASGRGVELIRNNGKNLPS